MPAEQSNLCDDIQPWLAAYALGEADDDAAARAHLAICADCQRSLREYQLVAGMLPYSAPEALPSPALREHVIAAIARESATPDGTEVQAAHPAPSTRPPAPRHALARPNQPRRPRSFWAAIATALLALAMLGWNMALRGEVASQGAEIAFHRQSWQTMIVLLDDPALRLYSLVADPANSTAASLHGNFWSVPQGQVACLIAQNLPDLQEGQTYHVWLVRGDQQTSGGTFEAHGGNAWSIVRSDEPISDYSAVFVTIEPGDGTSWPSGPRVLSVALSSARAPGTAERLELRGMLAAQEASN